ncbi:MAG: hypothetical protein ABII06_04790 [Pseudomonadota bacterium]
MALIRPHLHRARPNWPYVRQFHLLGKGKTYRAGEVLERGLWFLPLSPELKQGLKACRDQ